MGRQKIRKFPVTFRNVNLGQKTAKVGIVVERGNMTLEEAAELFVERRLMGEIVLGANGDGDGQKHLVDDLERTIKGSMDVTRFGVGADNFTAGLTFNKNEVDVSELSHFTKGQGRLVIKRADDIPAGASVSVLDEDDETEDDE